MLTRTIDTCSALVLESFEENPNASLRSISRYIYKIYALQKFYILTNMGKIDTKLLHN